MYNIKYSIIGTGSTGNAVVLNDNILVDAGVSFKAIHPHLHALKLVLLTHIHGDHFNRATIRRLASERPTLRFGCGAWLAPELVKEGLGKERIDILTAGKSYNYGAFHVLPVKLMHNVPNQGYKIHFAGGGKTIYATDTGSLAGITAKDYDLYMIECNYEDDELDARIREKERNGEFAYEHRAKLNHLSKARCDAWIYANIGDTGEYIYMHQHQDRQRRAEA